MFLISFYRFYFAVLLGVLTYLLIIRSVWLGVAVMIATRTIWWLCERTIADMRIKASIQRHIGPFKQQHGPYGIRLANKAENDRRVRDSLAEVFVADYTSLKKCVDQLEVMDVMFKAGMRPEGDEYLLHDLKLKYGRHRLEAEFKQRHTDESAKKLPS